MYAKSPEAKPRVLWNPQRRGTYTNPWRQVPFRPWMSRGQRLRERREHLWSVA